MKEWENRKQLVKRKKQGLMKWKQAIIKKKSRRKTVKLNEDMGKKKISKRKWNKLNKIWKAFNENDELYWHDEK